MEVLSIAESVKYHISGRAITQIIERLPQLDFTSEIGYTRTERIFDDLGGRYFIVCEIEVNVDRGNESRRYDRPGGSWVESQSAQVNWLYMTDEEGNEIELTPEQEKKLKIAIEGRVEI